MSKAPAVTSDAFNEEAARFDIQSNVIQRRYAAWGWRVAGVLGVGLVVLSISQAIIATRPAPPPGIVRVDEATGSVEVVPRVADAKESYGETVDKFFLARYVRAREGYSYATAGANYTLVGLMSSPAEKQLYFRTFDPRQNKNSIVNVLGEVGRAEVKIKSRSFLKSEKGLVGVVRWSLETRRSPVEDAETTHWVSTITYKYGTPPKTDEERDLSPLGFVVLNYRKDSDTGVDSSRAQAPSKPEPVEEAPAASRSAVRLFPGS
ncbi:virB8 family protein [Achromobacter spanius]|uniref:virB8 family protein n=1 Tax=Achromobacter spanius TaxID=217203 RepID=UPI003829E45F